MTIYVNQDGPNVTLTGRGVDRTELQRELQERTASYVYSGYRILRRAAPWTEGSSFCVEVELIRGVS